MKRLFVAGALVATLLCTGCTTIAADVSNVAQELSSSTPTQVTTLGDAQLAATTITRLADAAVRSGKLDRATLITIGKDSDAVHAALNDLEAAQANGQSLVFAAFNSALQQWRASATSEGIAH